MAVIRPITIEIFRNEYEQLRTPDFSAIASYVNRAKGQDRSMAQFAEDTGIGASTLSRIVNGKNTKPLTKEIIIKIYECRANPEDEYLLESLARANGMHDRKFVERARDDDFTRRRNNEINRDLMMKNAIVASVAACGFPIERVINSPLLCPNALDQLPAYFPRRKGDYVIEFSDAASDKINKSWTFFNFPTLIDETPNERRYAPSYYARRIFERISAWLMIDAWTPEMLAGEKFSFAFIDEEIFYAFIQAFKDAKLNTEMTALLVDPINFKVIKEVWLSGNYTPLTNISVFEVPMPHSDEDDDDEYHGYYDEE